MAKLSPKKRESLPSAEFGLPGERKYPMPDESHARNAKARASQQESEGKITGAQKQKIDRKADRILDDA
jgi:hypothetical protein